MADLSSVNRNAKSSSGTREANIFVSETRGQTDKQTSQTDRQVDSVDGQTDGEMGWLDGQECMRLVVVRSSALRHTEGLSVVRSAFLWRRCARRWLLWRSLLSGGQPKCCRTKTGILQSPWLQRPELGAGPCRD